MSIFTGNFHLIFFQIEHRILANIFYFVLLYKTGSRINLNGREAIQIYGGIGLSLTYNINYFNTRDNYRHVNMKLFIVNMQHIYADIQHNLVNMRDEYDAC